MTLNERVRRIIVDVLAEAGSQKHAARLLGISPRVLNYKMKMLGIPRLRDPKTDNPIDMSRRFVMFFNSNTEDQFSNEWIVGVLKEEYITQDYIDAPVEILYHHKDFTIAAGMLAIMVEKTPVFRPDKGQLPSETR